MRGIQAVIAIRRTQLRVEAIGGVRDIRLSRSIVVRPLRMLLLKWGIVCTGPLRIMAPTQAMVAKPI